MQRCGSNTVAKYFTGLLVAAGVLCFGGCNVWPRDVAGDQDTGPDAAMLLVEPAAIYLGEAGTSVQVQFTNTSEYDLAVETSIAYVDGPKDWLTVTPAAAECPTSEKISFDLSANRDIVPAGAWQAELTMSAGGIKKTVMVSIAVVAVAASVERCDFGTSSAPLQVQVWNAGGGTLQYQVEDAPAWLAVEGGSGSSSGPGDRKTISLSVDRADLPAGTYGGQITIVPVAGQRGFRQTIDVSMTVPPRLTIQASAAGGQAPVTVDFTAMDGASPAANLPAGSILNWDFGDSTPVAHGTSVGHKFTSGGTYVVALGLTLAGGLGTVGCSEATITVTDPAPQPGSLVVSPTTGLSAAGMVGGPFAPSTKTYTLSNPGRTSIAWTAGAAGPPWVHVSKTGGTLAAGATDTVAVSINATADGLLAGSYGGSVTFVNTTNHTGDTSRSVELAVNAWPTANVTPVANAGPDINLDDEDDNGQEVVTLNGSASSDPDGTIVSYRWSEGANVLATTTSPTTQVTLSRGTHTITLEVTDNRRGSSTSDVTITINEVYASSLSQYGITWTFDKRYRVGKFVNGDWWVVPRQTTGVVLIVSVDPAPTGTGEAFRNGSMANPIPGYSQAYDGRAMYFTQASATVFPYQMSGNTSLISTVSRPENADFVGSTGHRGRIAQAAVLTCLRESAPADSFRPPYCGQSKPLYCRRSLDLGCLPSLASVPNTPPLVSFYNGTLKDGAGTVDLSKVWLDHVVDYGNQHIHPMDHMPYYGRDIARYIGDASLMLCLGDVGDRTILATYLCQLGIDLCGIARNGGYWPANGGHNCGRKWPIILAGLLLQDEQMRLVGFSESTATSWRFHEDEQTFIVMGVDLARQINVAISGTVLATTADTVTIGGLPGYTNLKGNYIEISAGPGAGQRRYISGSDEPWGSGPYQATATVSEPWITPLVAGQSKFRIPGYELAHLNMGEWGIAHVSVPERDNPSWYANYRLVNGYSWVGFILAARILDQREAWNHEALFLYQDRHMQMTAPSGSYPGWRALSLFAEKMWDKYRADY